MKKNQILTKNGSFLSILNRVVIITLYNDLKYLRQNKYFESLCSNSLKAVKKSDMVNTYRPLYLILFKYFLDLFDYVIVYNINGYHGYMF